jgi:hypothetical protein
MVATDLTQGERIVFRSKRGGIAGNSGWMWLLFIIGGSQVCGAITAFAVLFSDGPNEKGPSVSVFLMPAATVVVAFVLLVLWIRYKRQPAYFVTERRLIARPFLLAPLVMDLRNVAGANRILVQYTRYGRVVNEILTNRIGVQLRSGGGHRFGPVEDADELVALLQGVAQGVVDCRALPDADGGLSRAEERRDLFFARWTLTAGLPRGPLFVGPTKVIGFAEALLLPRQQQMLTVAGAERSAHDVEQSVLELAKSMEFGRGRAVVMEREGVTLAVDGSRFLLTSGSHVVAFELDEKDAKRAAKFVRETQIHGYRG